MRTKNREIKTIFAVVVIVFGIFLAYPMIRLLLKSFIGDTGATTAFYHAVLTEKGIVKAIINSFKVAGASALLTTILAFFMAYTVHYSNAPGWGKKVIHVAAVLPMFLPTLTYGFAIIYSFGKQGLLTRLFGHQLFEIYGFNGLLLGYVIYTLPVSFMLINNTMGYIDKKFTVVSRLMGDGSVATFVMTVFRPLLGTLAASFIQTFFLCFTDFGIPASVGGKYEVIASVLYTQMLGSVPDFNKGSVVAMIMLIPSIVSILILHILEKYNIRYNKISPLETRENKFRDIVCSVVSLAICLSVLSVFAVIFIIPFVGDWPYNLQFSLTHFQAVFSDDGLLSVYKNSIFVAVLTALFGTLAAYGAAIITARSTVSSKMKQIIEGVALVTNTIPGMVLGLAYLFCFSGTGLQSTFAILIICNMIHFFSTPYLMMKSSLAKMNASWETTAMLMGDNWVKTIIRVLTPNAMSTIIEVFSYYFVNAMVTVSAVIFIAGARTMVMTTKIKELQYYNKFNEVFVLSLLMLATNLLVKAIFQLLANRQSIQKKEKNKMKKTKGFRKVITAGLAGVLALSAIVTGGCGAKTAESQKVVIYSNADDEAVDAMKAALDNNGYKDQYIFQTFGTSELGGKILAEGKNIEADMITMSTFYVESAQDQNQMFKDLAFDVKTLDEFPSYCAPITAQEGTIIVNTELMQENNLTMPTSLKDLAKPEYKGMISVTDIASSSTAWLLIQGLISAYGEDGAKEVLKDIYENAGDHIEESGSGPLKLVRAGEVAIGFGLRQQAVADKAAGLPIDYVDPAEGNFTLTESVAVIDKGDKSNEKAMEMAQCIIENGRQALLENYPIALYEGETVDDAEKSGNPQTFPEKLTVDLLKQHQALSEECKPQ